MGMKAAFSQIIVLPSGSDAAMNIKKEQISFLLESPEVKGFAAVRQLAFQPFSLLPSDSISTRSVLWYRFQLANPDPSDRALVIQVPKTGKAVLYLENAGGTDSLISGGLVPLPERSVASHTTSFRLIISREDTIGLFFRQDQGYSIYAAIPENIRIIDRFQYEQKDKNQLLLQGLFLGMILVMALYNLFIGFAVKDTSYLYYVLSIIGLGTYFAFYYGFGIERLWPSRPYWDTFCYLMIVPFNGMVRLLFTRTYLGTATLLPRLNQWINLLLALNICCFLAGAYIYLTRTDHILTLVKIMGFVTTGSYLMMLVSGLVAYYRKQYQPAKFFIWANIVLVIGAVLFIMREIGLAPDTFLTRYLVQIGFLIQIILFSLGLASRLNEMRSQLANETLERERLALEQEKEKKSLIESQRRELEEQVVKQTARLTQKNEELSQLNQVKDKLFSIISHDLRNPLATMQSFLKLITEFHDKLSEEEKVKLFSEAQASLDNVNMLMYNLLLWSRSQMNMLQFKPVRIPFQSFVQSSLSPLQLHARMKEVELLTDIPAELNLCADREMLAFILRNLVSNAIKFSYRGGRVLIKAEQQEDSINISVTDDGIGMGDTRIRDVLGSNLSPSQRGTEKEKGTGLGLFISREFLEKHHSDLQIISEPGKGTTVAFVVSSRPAGC